jgi:hypothetical protein
MRGEHNTWPSFSRAYQAPLPTTMMLTCPHLAVCLHPHVPPCHLTHCTNHVNVTVPPMTARTTLPSPLQLHALHHHPPHGCMHCVAVPLVAACITSLCPSWLHTRVAVLLACLYIFLFLISTNFLFCGPVTALSPSLLMDAWPSSPSRAYHGATTDHQLQ